MSYAQLAPVPTGSTGSSALLDFRRLALRLLGPVREAHRRLTLRQQFESLSDRQLADIGVAREDIPAVVRERWIDATDLGRRRSLGAGLRLPIGAAGPRGR